VVRTLHSRRLRRVLFAYTINRLGNWLGLVALTLAVFDHTHSALAVAALLLAWQALPAFVAPALVARVEASTRGGELSRLYLFEGLATAALAVLVWHYFLPGLLLIALLDGTAALAANALLRSAIARIAKEQPAHADAGDGATRAEAGVGPAHTRDAEAAERSANAALNVGFAIAFVAGPIIGGVLSASVGVPTVLLIDVGTFVICGALLFDLRAHVEESAGDTVAARLRAAWAHINTASSLRALLITNFVAFVMLQAGGPIEVALVKTTLHGGDSGYGLFVTAWGAGALAASVLFALSMARPLGLMLSVAIFSEGAAFVGVSAAPSIALACAAAFLAGVGNGLYLPSIISLVQRLTPPGLHGRLIGAVESLDGLALALGLPLGGALVALSSPRTAFLVLGLGTLAITIAYVRITVTSSRAASGAGDGPASGVSGARPAALAPHEAAQK
jgi:MFS family permease